MEPSESDSDHRRRRKVRRRLADQLQQAQEEYHQAAARGRQASKQFIGSVFPDNTAVISYTVKDIERATSALEAATKRWLEFIMHGIVPDDLDDPEET